MINLAQWQVMAMLALVSALAAIGSLAVAIRRSRYDRAIRRRMNELTNESGQLAVIENSAQARPRKPAQETTENISRAA